MSYTNGTCALQLPSSYVLMDEEEMTYVEGGSIACSRLAPIIDGAVTLVSIGLGGIAHLASTGGKRLLVKNWTKIVAAVSKVLSRIGTAGTLLQGVLNLVNANSSWLHWASIGEICAYGIDALEPGAMRGNYVVGA